MAEVALATEVVLRWTLTFHLPLPTRDHKNLSSTKNKTEVWFSLNNHFSIQIY